MKHILYTSALIFISSFLFAQSNVGIGTTSPNASAELEIQSSNKGVLIPRMSTAQRTAIPSPATGLLVFDSSTQSFWFYEGTGWNELVGNNNGLRDNDKDTRVEVEKFADEDRVRITASSADVAQFAPNDVYLIGRTSIGTPTKRGLLTLRGPNDIEFGPTLFMYGNSADQTQSGRIRLSEGVSSTNWRGGYMHYDGFSNLMHLGVHNTTDNLPANDFNALTIRRTNGYVGINKISPLHRLSVGGDFKVDNSSGITIETTANSISLKAGTSTVVITENGNIDITTQNGDIDFTSTSGDINFNANAGRINLNGNLVNLSAASIAKINGAIVDINSGAGVGRRAARTGDGVNIPAMGGGFFPILNGSNTVFIGN